MYAYMLLAWPRRSGGEPKIAANAEPLLTAREVADLLGLSVASVLRRWRAGEIPGFRLSANVLRFRQSEINAYLEAHRGHATVYAPAYLGERKG
jgi:excisionase family DNA binding protein